MTAKPLDIGDIYGELTVTCKTNMTDGHGHRLWECICSCGKVVKVTSSKLRNGNNKSCGCLKVKRVNGWHEKGKNHPAWKGGKYIDSNGYVMVQMPSHSRAGKNGYVAEHILVAESMVNRQISQNEEVHHDDGNRSNNQPSNLVVFPSKSAHILHHHRLKREANG